MDKLIPHYKLEAIKAIVSAEGIAAFTATARDGARQMGLDNDQAVGVITTLTRAMFYKSMTTHQDHRVWQDMYHAPCQNGKTAYIKLTLRSDNTVVIQFKEK